MAIEFEGRPIRLHVLADLLGAEGATDGGAALAAIVVKSFNERVAFVVDRICDEQELITKDLGEHLGQVPNVAGTTVLADGRIVPVLDTTDLVRCARGIASAGVLFADAAKGAVARRTVLVVDDSITTRTLEKSILEAAGYRVRVATDGVEALESLARDPVDLILADIQMPRMNGLQLTERLKGQESTRTIPVVLVSSLASDDDRLQGLRAGADAYVVKGEFDQGALLEILAGLL
jgi:two-component system chemotaxis sensor kinase CheA